MVSARTGGKRLERRGDGRTYLTTAGAARMLGVSEAFVLRVSGREYEGGVGLNPVGLRLTCLLYSREEVRRFAEGEPMPWLKERRRERRRVAGLTDAERYEELKEEREATLTPDRHRARKFRAMLEREEREERVARADAGVARWRKRKEERAWRRLKEEEG